MGLKDEMTWSHGDKKKRTLAYLDRCVADREGNKFVMTREETIFNQRGDQHLKEFVVAELVNEDKGKFSNFRNYNEELDMLEDWLLNPKIDKDDCLMFYCSIRKEQTIDKSIELFYNLLDSSTKSRG